MANERQAQFAQSLALFGERVRAVAPHQWDHGTPCTEWTVRDLVNHVAGELLWVPPLVTESRTIAEVGDAFDGDVLGADPVGLWNRAATAAQDAFGGPGALERSVALSYGPTPAGAYCAQLTADVVVHTWDLSRGLQAPERLPEQLVEFALKEYLPYAAALARSGLFAKPYDPPPGADAQSRLLALTGRRP
ncbi:TIGR03086 family metal-binding protein [Streptomyces sp. NPDC006879]|uniref:TIGR03086 family metal-binding protein n=1 Tax=Streptomyces sp. NPDC006879 TaxID=3364767 RepID=UPI00367E1CE8